MNFYLQYMIFTVKVYDGDGRKKPENEKDETKEKRFFPFGCSPIPPSIKLEADCFPGRKNRKQAGPTLGWTGILIYRSKKKLGVGRGMCRYKQVI